MVIQNSWCWTNIAQYKNVSGNPLICDCELSWFKQFAEGKWNEVEKLWIDPTFCSDPNDITVEHNIVKEDLEDKYCTKDSEPETELNVALRLFANWAVIAINSVFHLF